MALIEALRQFIGSLGYMALPRVCPVCHGSLVDGERSLCLTCLAELPRLDMHRGGFNAIHERLASPGVMVERAGAWFSYSPRSRFAAIVHDAKYRNMPSVARDCGALYASEIKGDGFFDGIDVLCPVPIFSDKERARGYNQAREIALGVSSVTGLPVYDNLVAMRDHQSQTLKGAWQRWRNTADIYGVKCPDELTGKHILIIDDVITTGSTMLRCIEAVYAAAAPCRVSVAALCATLRK